MIITFCDDCGEHADCSPTPAGLLCEYCADTPEIDYDGPIEDECEGE